MSAVSYEFSKVFYPVRRNPHNRPGYGDGRSGLAVMVEKESRNAADSGLELLVVHGKSNGHSVKFLSNGLSFNDGPGRAKMEVCSLQICVKIRFTHPA